MFDEHGYVRSESTWIRAALDYSRRAGTRFGRVSNGRAPQQPASLCLLLQTCGWDARVAGDRVELAQRGAWGAAPVPTVDQSVTSYLRELAEQVQPARVFDLNDPRLSTAMAGCGRRARGHSTP